MQESTICSKCGLTVDRILSLECTHNLCVRCSARQITRLQKLKPGVAVTHLECEICGVVSYLHPSTYEQLAVKKQQLLAQPDITVGHISYSTLPQPSFERLVTPPSPSRSFKPYSHPTNPPHMLFCFSCETQCFSIDDYLSGLHKNHQVVNTTKPESINTLKTLLGDINDKVRKRIETALKQSTKLTQKKRQLIQQLGRTKATLRSVFDRLREAILSKQSQLITELQTFMSRKFNIVDGALLQVKLFTQKCQTLQDNLRCYSQAILPADVVKAYDFYSQRKGDICEQIAFNIQQVAQKAVGNAGGLVMQYESLLDLNQQVKRAKIVVGEQKGEPQDNYFQVIRQEIFNQRTRREASQKNANFNLDILGTKEPKEGRNMLEIPSSPSNPSLSRIKSLGDFRIPTDDRATTTLKKQPFNETSIGLQSRLKQKMRGLQSIRQRQHTRMLRRFNFL